MTVENRGSGSVGITIQQCTDTQGDKVFGEVLEYQREDVDHWQRRGHGDWLVAHRDSARADH